MLRFETLGICTCNSRELFFGKGVVVVCGKDFLRFRCAYVNANKIPYEPQRDRWVSDEKNVIECLYPFILMFSPVNTCESSVL